jgi:hypothetical protein
VESSASSGGSLMASAISKTKGTPGRGEGEMVWWRRRFTRVEEAWEASRWKSSAAAQPETQGSGSLLRGRTRWGFTGWGGPKAGACRTRLMGQLGKINETRLKVGLGHQGYRTKRTLGRTEIKRKFSQFLFSQFE